MSELGPETFEDPEAEGLKDGDEIKPALPVIPERPKLTLTGMRAMQGIPPEEETVQDKPAEPEGSETEKSEEVSETKAE